MVEACLNALGVKTIDQWDVLVFLHRHRIVLLGAEHIARLMRHETGMIVTALDCLSSLGLVERSRPSGGVCFYQVASLADLQSQSFEELLMLDSTRHGRLRLAACLREANQRTSLHTRMRHAKAGVASGAMTH